MEDKKKIMKFDRNCVDFDRLYEKNFNADFDGGLCKQFLISEKSLNP